MCVCGWDSPLFLGEFRVGRRGRCCASIAVIELPHVRALPTLDAATPVELAVTVVLLLLHQRVVPTPTAHQRAPVQSVTRLVALPAPGP